jgi:hypothetical protein
LGANVTWSGAKTRQVCAFFDREADVSTPLAQKTWQTGFLDPSKFRFCSRFSLHGVHCMFTTLHSAGISRGGSPLRGKLDFCSDVTNAADCYYGLN